jgi:transcription elongation factor S-II
MSLLKVENPELFRNNIRNKINNILENEKKSINLEKGIFNFSLKEADRYKIIKKWDNRKFVQIYEDRVRSIMMNLKSEILQQIKDGSILPQTAAFMTHQEMCPDKWHTLIEAKVKRDKNKFEVNMSAATDTFTCRKCKGNKCTYYEMQTRSADEPMTCYVSCLTCGNRWKC